MKRKTLIRAAALALTAALLFTGCTARTSEENPESSGSSQSSMAEQEKAESSGTKAAEVAVPLENAPSIIPMPEERPCLYEENGSYGFRAADGSVLVPAEYAFGYDFDDNGLGQLRKDEGEEITLVHRGSGRDAAGRCERCHSTDRRRVGGGCGAHK